MSIDEAIAHAREVANGNFDDRVHCTRCSEFYEHLEELLEELKDYRDKNKMVVRIDCINSEEFNDLAVKLAKEQYNKAIDDYKYLLAERLEAGRCVDEKFAYIDLCDIDELAEQLKAGESE